MAKLTKSLKLTIKTDWDFSTIYKSDNDPAMAKDTQALKDASYAFINKWKNRKDYLTDPVVLKQALDEYEALLRIIVYGDELYYFWLKTQLDQINPELKARYNKINKLSNEIEVDMEFFLHRLAMVPQKYKDLFVKHPQLVEYRHFLEMLFVNAKYLLSEPEEKILMLKSETSHSKWAKLTSRFVSKEKITVLTESGEKKEIDFHATSSYAVSPMRKVRQYCDKEVKKVLQKYVDLAEYELNAILEDTHTTYKLKKIEQPYLPSILGDDLDPEIILLMNDQITKRFNLVHKYFQYKAKLLGLKKLRTFDMYAKVGTTNKKYKYAEAVNIVHDVLTKLDPEFVAIFKNYIGGGQLDVFPKSGKHGGGFCTKGGHNQKGYILLNYTNEIREVTTVAHEIGHAIHHELMKKHQNALNIDQSVATAETASTFFEDFALEQLIQQLPERDQQLLMLFKCEEIIGTVFMQPALFNFEIELHKQFDEKSYLSKDEITAMRLKYIKACAGPFIEYQDGDGFGWVTHSHLRDFFYNYQYTFGYLISQYFQAAVKYDPTYIKQVKKFLSAGSVNSPKKILLDLGMDISKSEFWNAGLDAVEKVFDRVIRDLSAEAT